MANARYEVKLTCSGTAGNPHSPRTVAQFRYEDGWGRIHDRKKRDQIVWEPDGELRSVHMIECDHPGCTRAQPRPVSSERLYPSLDYARSHGQAEVRLR